MRRIICARMTDIDASRDEISRFCALLPMSSGIPIRREDVAQLATRPREDDIEISRLVVLD